MNTQMIKACAAQLREVGRCEANLARHLRQLEAYDGESADGWTPENDSHSVALREELRQAQVFLNAAQQMHLTEMMAAEILERNETQA